MAIRGMKGIPITEFTGKDTTSNLSNEAIGTLIAAQNAMILADANVRRAPGYTQVFTDASLAAVDPPIYPVTSMFDFQRSVDQRQFFLIQRGPNLWVSEVVAGIPAAPSLIATLTSPLPLEYVPSTFICYATNGVDAIRLVDNGGQLLPFRWGIAQPKTNPSEAIQIPGGTIAGLTYAWDFGDGATSTAANPTHTYAADNIYVVQLTVTNPYGQSATANGIATIGAIPSLLLSPNGPYLGQANSQLNFTASNTDSASSYTWFFGDGNSATGISVSNLYAAAGTYQITLVGVDALGNVRQVFTSAAIADPISLVVATIPIPAGSGVTGSPAARITGPETQVVGVAIALSAVASSDPNGLTLTYAWDFGDGTTATGSTPTKTFAALGTYTVIMTATNTAGLFSSDVMYFRVTNNVPTANPGGPYYQVSGSPVSFSSAGSTLVTGISLTYGRNYVASMVCKYTDSLGIQRVHVGAASVISASLYTGPLANQEVLLTLPYADIAPDVQVNYVWFFATIDAPQDTSATFYFLGESAVVTPGPGITFIDNLSDVEFDQTRLAPFSNFPAPPSTILTRFQSRIFAIMRNLMQFSGGPDITLGIPDEAFPPDNFFNIPAGVRLPTVAAVINEGNLLAISNGDTWFNYTGYDASTFTEADKVASPGQAGRWAGTLTPYGYAYLSPSKRLWIWDGETNPKELSAHMARTLLGTFGMDDIDPAYIAFARVHWYSQGVQHFLAVIARTTSADPATLTGTPNVAIPMDWMSIWGVPAAGITSVNTVGVISANALYPTDKFPTDYPSCSADVLIKNVPYIFFGTLDNGVHRFPEMFLDAGNPYPSSFSHAWIAPVEGDSRYFWIDIFVDVSDTTAALLLGGPEHFMQVSARVMETPEDTPNGLAATLLDLARIPKPLESQQSVFALRAKLGVSGCSIGRYIRLNITLAKGVAAIPFDVVVQKVVLQSAAVYVGAP